jgi:signal transduction histidine kinase
VETSAHAPSSDELPDLKRELLFGLALLAATALSLAVVATLLAQLLQPRFAVAALVLLIAANVAVLFAFGRHLIERLVLGPLRTLKDAADEVAAGNLLHVAPPADTQEFTHLAGRFNHMTERLQDAQRQLVRAEKLASIGRLAAGVAHEVGNPLAAIGTYLEVLGKRGADPGVVNSISRETARIDSIVRGLLEYAGPREDRTGRVDVATVIQSVVDLLTHQGTLNGLTLRHEIESDSLWVRGRAHALEQVAVNLLLNAADAAPGGIVSVGAMRMDYHASMVGEQRRSDAPTPPPDHRLSSRRPWRPELEEGTPGIVFWVADSGPGVPDADREKIFDPFFTTKPPGRGTGLGLAIVIRTVDEMGGVVWVDDAREGGAAFKVFLPADQRGSGSHDQRERTAQKHGSSVPLVRERSGVVA